VKVAGAPNGQGVESVALVPDVKILRIARPDSTQPTAGLMVTFALKPRDALRVVFAEENGSVWLGLLPPGQTGTGQPPFNVSQVGR
jgi:hypothetical protein